MIQLTPTQPAGAGRLHYVCPKCHQMFHEVGPDRPNHNLKDCWTMHKESYCGG